MTCEQALEAISAALDGELSGAEEKEWEDHLASCPACRALCDDLRAIEADVLDSVLEVPEGFHDRVMAAVAEEPAVAPVRKKHSWKGWGGLAAVAAVAVLAVGPGLFAGGGNGGGENLAAAPSAVSMLTTGEESAPVSDAAAPAEEKSQLDAEPYQYRMEDRELPALEGELEDLPGAAPADTLGYLAVVTVDGALPEGYSWDEFGRLELPAEELSSIEAALNEAGVGYTVQDSGPGIAPDGIWVLVRPGA